MKGIKRLLFFLVFLQVASFLNGCEFKDIDKRFFITAIGVDKGSVSEKKYRVSLKIAIPKGQLQMGQEDYITVSMDGNSITEAIQKLKATSDKEFDFGHTKVLAVGEEIARKDYRDPLDWFIRQRFLQRIAWVVVAKPSAEKLLLAKQKSERLPANALILAFGGQGVESQYIVSQYLFQFYRKSKDPGETPVLPYAEPEQAQNGSYYKIDTAALFNQTSLVLKLTPDETKYYNVLATDVNKSDYQVSTDGNQFTIHADIVDVKPTLQNNKIVLDVKLDGIVEEERNREKVTNIVLNKIERATERDFSKAALSLLKKFQKYKVDPMGFGSLYRTKHRDPLAKEIKDWKEKYPNMHFDVHTTCKLRTPGTIE